MNAQEQKMVQALAHWGAHPVEFVKDVFGATPEDYQGDILTSLLSTDPDLRGMSRLVAKSGHGVGKTTTEAWASHIFLNTRPLSRMVATAPVFPQITDILWPEIAKWHQTMPDMLKGMWRISERHIRHVEYEKEWFGVGRSSNKSENMQGFHSKHILVLCEEASGIPQNIFEVIEGILSNAEEGDEEALLFLAGNPTQTAGEMYDAFHRNKNVYTRFTISGDPIPPDDPNGGRIYCSTRVTEAFRKTMERKYGKDSAVYDVRVRGMFPTLADGVVIPLAWAERAQHVLLPHFDAVADGITLVMDPARFGGDETVLGIFRRNHCIAIRAWPKTSTTECVDILYDQYTNSRVPVIRIVVDEPGVGGGVIDGARRIGLPITPYHGGLTMKTDVDAENDVRMFFNRRSRDWWNVRRLMEQGLVHIPDDETLVNQLASVKYDYVNEKIKVETKKEMKERLGQDASPDRADIIVMGLAPYTSLVDALPIELFGVDNENDLIVGSERPTAEMFADGAF